MNKERFVRISQKVRTFAQVLFFCIRSIYSNYKENSIQSATAKKDVQGVKVIKNQKAEEPVTPPLAQKTLPVTPVMPYSTFLDKEEGALLDFESHRKKLEEKPRPLKKRSSPPKSPQYPSPADVRSYLMNGRGTGGPKPA